MISRDKYLNQIKDFIDKPVIKVITGMRRCGKSVILQQIQELLICRGVDETQIFYINFESLKYEDLKDYRSLYQTISDAAQKSDSRLYILLDEIQEVDGWEKAVNSFRVDFDCDIYITGSNARLFAGDLGTLLSGRYVEIRIYPLSFNEYLAFAEANEEEKELSIQENFANYLRYGGLPGIHEMKWEEERIYQYLYDIYNSVLLKDVIKRNNIRDTSLLENIIKYLMDNIGNTFSAKTISDFLKSQGRKLSTETVYNYLHALENAFLIHKVSRYDIKGKRLLETQEKFYLSDLGIRHAVIGYHDDDISGLLENIVYLELLRNGYSVRIGKQGAAKVDFVADRGDERAYLQICYILTKENTDREFRPLESIRDNYEKTVLTTDTLLQINRGGIRQKNIIEYLTGLDKTQ